MVATFSLVAIISSYSPEVGIPNRCADLKEKPKSDWTANQATGFTKNCVL
ncbi:MAG: DUF3012 domain-containing protein [Alphaproteobacteria bacterium]